MLSKIVVFSLFLSPLCPFHPFQPFQPMSHLVVPSLKEALNSATPSAV